MAWAVVVSVAWARRYGRYEMIAFSPAVSFIQKFQLPEARSSVSCIPWFELG